MMHKFPRNSWHFERLCEILPWMMPKFPTNSWKFHGHLPNFLGIYSIFMVLCQFPGNFWYFQGFDKRPHSTMHKFPRNSWHFERLCEILPWMMPKFPTNSWEFYGHLTNFLGIYSILIVLCQFSLGIFGIFKDLTRDHISWCTNFLGIPWHFERFCEILPWMMPKFPTNSWEFHGHLTNFLGIYSILIVLCQFPWEFLYFQGFDKRSHFMVHKFPRNSCILKDSLKFCLGRCLNFPQIPGNFMDI